MSFWKRHRIDTNLQTLANKYHGFLFFNNDAFAVNTVFSMENRIRDGFQNGKVGQIITGCPRIICGEQIFMCERVYSYASFTAICDIFAKVSMVYWIRRYETGMLSVFFIFYTFRIYDV